MNTSFFENALFGKRVINFQECSSSNDKLKSILKNEDLDEGTVIITQHQTMGKGQRGNIWLDEPNKNLLISVLLKPNFILLQNQYLLNVVVGLAVRDTVSQYTQKQVSLKWPNDIYVEDKKIGGILIENIILKLTVDASVVGVGININQQGFSMTNATSLYLETDLKHNMASITKKFLPILEQYYAELKNEKIDYLRAQYHKHLMWRDTLHRFRANGNDFEGTIQGIDKQGRIIIRSSHTTSVFDVKEVTFLR